MKIYLKIIALIVYLYGCAWCFNHVNPWAGIGLFLLLIGAIILFNPNKKQQ